MILKKEAKHRIKELWIEQGKPSSDFEEAMPLYNFIKRNYPVLFTFRKPKNEDYYQILKGFICDYQKDD